MSLLRVSLVANNVEGRANGTDITATQQGILRDVYGDISGIPQMWCMYKEVAEYFVKGVSSDTLNIIGRADDFSSKSLKTSRSSLPMTTTGTSCRCSHLGWTTKPEPVFTTTLIVSSLLLHWLGSRLTIDVGMPRAYKWINTINLAKSTSCQIT